MHLTRITVVTTTTAALLLAISATALAGDGQSFLDCGQMPSPGCELGVEKQKKYGRKPVERERDRGEIESRPAPQLDENLTPPPVARCSYQRSDYRPPAGGIATVSHRQPQADPREVGEIVTAASGRARPAAMVPAVAAVPAQAQPPQPGAWYLWRCDGPGGADAMFRPPVWMPDAQPSPEELAQRAYRQLRLPSPQINSSPAGAQLVQLPSWLWLDRAGWQPISATAAVPGVSVTATATPSSVDWDMGDGATVSCPGPGTPFPEATDPQAASPDCGHTYRRSSQSAPGGRYPVTATVTWTVSWSGSGGAGTLPNLTTTATTTFPVAESQALNTAPR